MRLCAIPGGGSRWQGIMTRFESRARRAARITLFPPVVRLWQLALRVARSYLSAGPRPESWRPGGSVLIVAPHPDDETLGAGGAAALHVRHGDHVTVVVVTDGRSARGAGLDPETLVLRRADEVEAAGATLGVQEMRQLGLPEGAWQESRLREALAPLIARADVVYGPSCVDFHPDHLRVAAILADLMQPEQVVRVYELGVPLTPILANCVADVRTVREQRERALAAYVTQAEALRPGRRAARYRTALYGGSDVEVFWEIPGQGFRAAMAKGNWTWRTTPFRGFRPRPLTDLLPFVCGRSARLELRRIALRSARRPDDK